MAKFRCMVCSHIYDEDEGDYWNGINPTTKISELPKDWACPGCG